jgi:hypothetical protein
MMLNILVTHCTVAPLRLSLDGKWGGGGLHAVAQLVEALRYKPRGRGFDSLWYYWNFSLTSSFRSHHGPLIDAASDENEYQEFFLGVRVAGA